MTLGHQTQPGRPGQTNEDSLYLDPDLGLFIVADGMGGHNAGEVASALAVETAVKSVLKGLKAGKDPAQVLREAIADANAFVLTKSMNNPAWEAMGSTVVMALKNDHQVTVGHVGDSRAYLVLRDGIRQLTDDHTFVFEWFKQGKITKQQARTHSQRHGLTEVLGVTEDVEGQVAVWPLEDDTCLLLCSDGVTDVLEDHEILHIVNTSSRPQEACHALVSAAKAKGGRDDMTVILACC